MAGIGRAWVRRDLAALPRRHTGRPPLRSQVRFAPGPDARRYEAPKLSEPPACKKCGGPQIWRRNGRSRSGKPQRTAFCAACHRVYLKARAATPLVERSRYGKWLRHLLA